MPSELSKGDILTSYRRQLEELIMLGKEWNLTDEEIDEVIQASYDFLEDETQDIIKRFSARVPKKKKSSLCRFCLICIAIVLFISILIHILLTYKPTHNFLVRNIQDYIYPFMKILRLITLPIVRMFPRITVLYDELCLIENPYFQAVDINCWACEDVRSVLDLSGTEDPTKYQPHSAFPYIVKGAAPLVKYRELQELYEKNKVMMDRDAFKIKSDIWSETADLMSYKLESNPTPRQDSHIVWRMNRMEPARAVRQLFKRPEFIPSSINVERYIIIDEPKASPYMLPFPEGYKVFLMQCSGQRLIVLEPVPGCAANCTRVSVLMSASYLLYYDSWFYRPKSYPVENSTEIGLGYMGSF